MKILDLILESRTRARDPSRVFLRGPRGRVGLAGGGRLAGSGEGKKQGKKQGSKHSAQAVQANTVHNCTGYIHRKVGLKFTEN